eukprot:3304447-Pyramimonas_sp.AAC.1
MAMAIDEGREYLRKGKLTRPYSHNTKIQILELCVRGAMVQIKCGMTDDVYGCLEEWLPVSVTRGKYWHVP